MCSNLSCHQTVVYFLLLRYIPCRHVFVALVCVLLVLTILAAKQKQKKMCLYTCVRTSAREYIFIMHLLNQGCSLAYILWPTFLTFSLCMYICRSLSLSLSLSLCLYVCMCNFFFFISISLCFYSNNSVVGC